MHGKVGKESESGVVPFPKSNQMIGKTKFRMTDKFCDTLLALFRIQAGPGNWVEMHRLESV